MMTATTVLQLSPASAVYSTDGQQVEPKLLTLRSGRDVAEFTLSNDQAYLVIARSSSAGKLDSHSLIFVSLQYSGVRVPVLPRWFAQAAADRLHRFVPAPTTNLTGKLRKADLAAVYYSLDVSPADSRTNRLVKQLINWTPASEA